MSEMDHRGRAAGLALRGRAQRLAGRAPSSSVLARRLQRRRLARGVVAAGVVGIVAVLGLNLLPDRGSILIEPGDELPTPLPETPDPQAAAPEVCSRRGSTVLVADVLTAIASRQSDVTERFFVPEEQFRFFSDPDHWAGEITLDELDTYLGTPPELVAGHRLLAVDRHVVTDDGGKPTANVQFWIEPPTDVGPGAGHAGIDCDTGRFIQLAITAWSTIVDTEGPPATCSARAAETHLTELVDAVEADQTDAIERLFSPADIFDVYLDNATSSSGIRDPGSLAPHLTTIAPLPFDVDAWRLRYYAHVYWATTDIERQVGIARFTSAAPDPARDELTAALDCETGTILYLSVSDEDLDPL